MTSGVRAGARRRCRWRKARADAGAPELGDDALERRFGPIERPRLDQLCGRVFDQADVGPVSDHELVGQKGRRDHPDGADRGHHRAMLLAEAPLEELVQAGPVSLPLDRHACAQVGDRAWLRRQPWPGVAESGAGRDPGLQRGQGRHCASWARWRAAESRSALTISCSYVSGGRVGEVPRVEALDHHELVNRSQLQARVLHLREPVDVHRQAIGLVEEADAVEHLPGGRAAFPA